MPDDPPHPRLNDRERDPGTATPASSLSAAKGEATPGAEKLSFLQSFKQSFDEHLFFWIAFSVGILVFFFVPQIRNVWRQGPPQDAGLLFNVGYIIFFTLLLIFYGLSLFVVMRHSPILWVEDWRKELVKKWKKDGPPGLLASFARVLWWAHWLPELSSCWLVQLVSRKPSKPAEADSDEVTNQGSSRKLRKGLLWVALPLIVFGLIVGWIGAGGDSSEAYPLAGALCQNMGLLGLLVGGWLAGRDLLRRRTGNDELGPVGTYQLRIMAWILVTACVGEIIWLLASTSWTAHLVSYRLYTIWAAAQLLTILMILALLVDRWHVETDWPIRLVTLGLLFGGLWMWTGASTVPHEDFQRHLSSDERQALRKTPLADDDAKQQELRRQRWFEHLEKQINSIPENEGPVVLVAASGGGSRAATFTALALEALARTPLLPQEKMLAEKEKPKGTRTWADNIVLVSSVSGGSLATGYYVHRHQPDSFGEEIADLQNTTKKELIARLRQQVEGTIATFRENAPQFQPANLPEHVRGDLDLERTYLQQQREGLELLLTVSKGLQRFVPGVPNEGLRKELEPYDQFLELLWSEAYWRKLQEVDGDETKLGQEFRAHPQLARWRWVLRSKAFDAMCTDFMAPVMRGALTPALDRGDSLARFWTERFGWHNSTNFNGYKGPIAGWTYADHHPLVLFNACDVSKGSRLAIGFPPVPADLWEHVYAGKTSLEPPKALGQLDPDYRISLARAIRMSSNFPWGFRVMALRLHEGKKDPVHVLDGGVVDNTGLDTIYEVLHALEFYANEKNLEQLLARKRNEGPHDASSESETRRLEARLRFYQQKAKSILKGLRARGVVLVEIDSGAKPREQAPYGPLAGVTEPNQALSNAAHTSAEQVKRLYLTEVRRILTQNLEDLGETDREADACLAQFREKLSAMVPVFHVQFQCNHYQAGEASKTQDVMTAWTLGPADKAEIVGRFLVELGLWDVRKRRLAYEGLQQSQREFALLRSQANDRLIQERVTKQVQLARHRVREIARSIERIAADLKANKPLNQTVVTRVLFEVEAQKKRNDELAKQIGQLMRPEPFRQEVAALLVDLNEMDQQLRALGAGPAASVDTIVADLEKTSERVQRAITSVEVKLQDRRQDDGHRPLIGGPGESTKAVQRQLDYGAEKSREYLEKRPAKK